MGFFLGGNDIGRSPPRPCANSLHFAAESISVSISTCHDSIITFRLLLMTPKRHSVSKHWRHERQHRTAEKHRAAARGQCVYNRSTGDMQKTRLTRRIRSWLDIGVPIPPHSENHIGFPQFHRIADDWWQDAQHVDWISDSLTVLAVSTVGLLWQPTGNKLIQSSAIVWCTLRHRPAAMFVSEKVGLSSPGEDCAWQRTTYARKSPKNKMTSFRNFACNLKVAVYRHFRLITHM